MLLPDVGFTWSRCAFDRKPKIPIDVMNIKTIIAPKRYAFSKRGTSLFQLLYNQLAATSLPTSNAEPIAIIGITAPANNVARPMIEYPAAIIDIDMADRNVSIVKNIILYYTRF